MNIRWNRALLTLGVVTALAVPSAVQARQGSGGSGRSSDDQNQTASPGSTTTVVGETHGGGGGSNAGGPDRSGGSSANRSERVQFRGTVVSVDPVAQTIVVTVEKANHGHRGRVHLGQTITFDVSSARLDVRDVNGDGTPDVKDVVPGDAVEVRAELPRSGALDPTAPVVAQRLKDRSGQHVHHDTQRLNDGPNHG